MWIEGYQRKYRYDYVDVVHTFYNHYRGCEVTRTQRVYKAVPRWVPCKIWVGKRKYQKLEHHSKKVKTEKDIARDDWREKKQFSKDIGKASHRNRCKTFCKHYGWKSHRRHSKQAIKAEKYDKLHRKDYKHFIDPWDWD